MSRVRAIVQQERFVKEQPMSGAEYAAFYREQSEMHGVDAVAARTHGGEDLMVKSLEYPFYSVPYSIYAEQVQRRQAGMGEQDAGAA